MIQFFADSLGCPVTDYTGNEFNPSPTSEIEPSGNLAIKPTSKTTPQIQADNTKPLAIERVPDSELEDPTEIQTTALTLTGILDMLEETIPTAEKEINGIITELARIGEEQKKLVSQKIILSLEYETSTTDLTTAQAELDIVEQTVTQAQQNFSAAATALTQRNPSKMISIDLEDVTLQLTTLSETIRDGEQIKEKIITTKAHRGELDSQIEAIGDKIIENDTSTEALQTQQTTSQRHLTTLNELQREQDTLRTNITLVTEQTTITEETEAMITMRNNPTAQQVVKIFAEAAGAEDLGDTIPLGNDIIHWVVPPSQLLLEILEKHWQISQSQLLKLTSTLASFEQNISYIPIKLRMEIVKNIIQENIPDPQTIERMAATRDISQPPQPELNEEGIAAYRRIQAALASVQTVQTPG